MKEEWKDIVGFDGNYQISNFGNVKSVGRIITYEGTNQTGIIFKINKFCPEKYIKPYLRGGYYHVQFKKHSKSYNFTIHRLVAEHFIPNQESLPFINHKDENKLNNRVDNLEWCTAKHNANYGTRNKRIAEKLKEKAILYIPVLCYNLKNEFVGRYESAVAAGKALNVTPSEITACCRLYFGRTSAGGYKWKYEKSDINIEDIIYTPQKKIIHQLKLDGTFVSTYESLSHAARALGKVPQNFNKAVKKNIAYGFVWIIGENYNEVDNLLKDLYERSHHILQIDLNGNVVSRYKSALEAEATIGTKNIHSNISSAMIDKTKEGKLFRKVYGHYWVNLKTDPNYQIDYNFKKYHGEHKVIQCDLEGNEIRIFDSIADAQEYLGIPRNKISVIYDCVNKPYKAKSGYGFKWKKLS